MKILLVIPMQNYPSHPNFLSITDFPVGMAYIASALKQAGHEVIGLNPNNKPDYETAHRCLSNELSATITAHSPDMVGLGGLCTDYAFLRDAIRIIRKLTEAPIVLGGHIISKDPEFIMGDLKPDYGIVGEGEKAIVELAASLEHKGGGGIVPLIEREIGNIDDLPFPDYDVFAGATDYPMSTRILYRYSRAYPKPMTIITARGCPFSCTFCVHEGGPKYRTRSIPSIMEEIDWLYKKYEFNILIIGDELFAANKSRMIEFCNNVGFRRGANGWDFDWMFQTHPSAKLDEETLQLAKDAGCYFVAYGIESASQKVLDSMNKKSKVEDIKRTADLCEKVGIGFGGNLIFGDPAEDELTVRESMDFYAEYGVKNQIFLTLLQAYPGSKIFDDCIKRGIIEDKKSYYEEIQRNIHHMNQIPVQEWIAWAYYFKKMEPLWFGVAKTSCEIEDEPDSMHKVK